MKKYLALALAFAAAGLLGAQELRFDQLYKETVRGLQFSAQVKALAGQTVSMDGFMAPPLRASGDFFVLTKAPVSLCPFCNSDADWPSDILVVYLKSSQTFVQHNRPIRVSGRLEMGSYTDAATGFVSQLRLVDAEYRVK